MGSALELVTRCRADPIRVVDGDTYVLLCDLEQRSAKTHNALDLAVTEEGAATIRVRLRDYSCPERRTEAGAKAADAATRLLRSGPVTVEFKGEDTVGRLVGWLWVKDIPLGPELERQGHARLGAFEG